MRSTATSFNGASRVSFREPLRLWLGWAVLVLALALGARWLFLELEPPGQAIRGDLMAAAAEIRRLPWNAPPDSVRRAIALPFPRGGVAVDTAGLPAYATVTLLHLSKATCLDAEIAARRVDGSVVIALAAYASPKDCRDDNDMTWRLMP